MRIHMSTSETKPKRASKGRSRAYAARRAMTVPHTIDEKRWLTLHTSWDAVLASIEENVPKFIKVEDPPAKPRLAQFLQSDIKAGLVAVRDEVDRSVVTIRGDGLFAPASATIVPEREALMGRIADALTQVQGTVLVTGHSDNTPIRTARFPSNWHLSEERANTVRELLIARRVAPERIRAEGRAEAEPVAPNDTPTNRALNRRVEVSLMINGRAPDAPARGASR